MSVFIGFFVLVFALFFISADSTLLVGRPSEFKITHTLNSYISQKGVEMGHMLNTIKVSYVGVWPHINIR